jgi:hypothetical protein
MGYCYMQSQLLGIQICTSRYWVYHSRGDYGYQTKDPIRQAKATKVEVRLNWIEYSWHEIEATWKQLDRFAVENYDDLLSQQVQRTERRADMYERAMEELVRRAAEQEDPFRNFS